MHKQMGWPTQPKLQACDIHGGVQQHDLSTKDNTQCLSAQEREVKASYAKCSCRISFGSDLFEVL